ncbi:MULTISPECIES: hypothetical protein [Devosia]|uniref:Uncharacterized protein n=1 Tax=Devosia equisanguinis TaxID=2490941 RepID=A0A3S4CT85_9HYPH|nr:MULTISPECIES: hypothetical protein [Devosia]VDS05377.1 hypothetical protein DEVEQU_02519 [Devosia equisanguinis]
MRIYLTGAALAFGLALAGVANAAPGQCSMTGFDSFDCDVVVDGGGITFDLPDGSTFVFAHVADGAGLGYRIAPEARPGQLPEELGAFAPIEAEPGCWLGDKDNLKFCAAVLQ